MKVNSACILEDRGILFIDGEDSKDFLQNIITNDINKVSETNSCFASLLNPQGKFLFDFIVIKHKKGYFIDCDGNMTKKIIEFFEKYKLNSKIEIKNFSEKFVTGIISHAKFDEIKKIENTKAQTIWFRSSPCFVDPRSHKLGVRILSSLDKLYLTVKKLSLKIHKEDLYLDTAFKHGIPIIGINKLQDKLFGLEANFENYSAIDFKKGCFIGQENTARMKIRNKLRKRLVPVSSSLVLSEGDELICENKKIGEVLIGEKYPFALVRYDNENFSDLAEKEITINKKKIKLIQN